MKILLSPIRSNTALEAIVAGDVITLNGEVADFSSLPEGAVIPRHAIDSMWIAGDVSRVNGEIHLTILLPHGADAPEETRFPAAFSDPMTVTYGMVPLPPYNAPVIDEGSQPEQGGLLA
ncbi:hypothetical protein [Aeromonas hydrophila]|uniref:hypothetical protein n=1 Tax=Aeromonas hydrophila TaxID=644 RepID=UPI00259D78DB|nr:hypothetical protein [Aeromonas hydrophila]MDM5117190.1 hypothetical protein [Aeromonas hydrophila]